MRVLAQGDDISSSSVLFLKGFRARRVGPPNASLRPMYIPDRYTVLTAVTALLALALHVTLWAGQRGRESVRERAALMAHRIWWGLTTCVIALTAVSFAVQPHLIERFAAIPGAYILPVIGLAGLLGVFLCKTPETEGLAFLSSWGFLAGTAGSVAFGICSRSIPVAAGATRGAALAWWMPVALVALTYAVFTYTLAGFGYGDRDA